MITIKNLRNEKIYKPWQVRVDRASVLGNPFYISDESKRDEICDKYEVYFVALINGQAHKEGFLASLRHLLDIYMKYHILELFCWCAPKRCHAETIKRYIEKQIKLLDEYFI